MTRFMKGGLEQKINQAIYAQSYQTTVRRFLIIVSGKIQDIARIRSGYTEFDVPKVTNPRHPCEQMLTRERQSPHNQMQSTQHMSLLSNGLHTRQGHKGRITSNLLDSPQRWHSSRVRQTGASHTSSLPRSTDCRYMRNP